MIVFLEQLISLTVINDLSKINNITIVMKCNSPRLTSLQK